MSGPTSVHLPNPFLPAMLSGVLVHVQCGDELAVCCLAPQIVTADRQAHEPIRAEEATELGFEKDCKDVFSSRSRCLILV